MKNNKNQKEVLEGKKQAIKIIADNDTDTVVFATNTGVGVLGSTEDICKVISSLFFVLRKNNFPGLALLKEALDFAMMDDEAQKEYLKEELKGMIDKLNTKEEK